MFDKMILGILLIAIQAVLTTAVTGDNYVIDASVGFGRTFNGIGAISGGGATSKLLVNYPKQQQSEILDYLFKPNFGASLHIFKVEIGGDIQSTEGTEASHSHYGWDLDYTRGYEWWMLQEAKKRNPDIKLYGLPWGFPGWLRDTTDQPWKDIQTTADYVVSWIQGARSKYNLTIDYIGIWNESPYNVTYIKTLRKTLNKAGFSSTLIIASDQNGWKIAEDMAKDQELSDAIYALGSHYPDKKSTPLAQQTGKPLWASEDRVDQLARYSILHNKMLSCFTHLGLRALGCRMTLNENYVTGYMTSTVLWNVVVSYYFGLPWVNSGLMTAREPWSGYYDVRDSIWFTAHTTQFTKIGWKYLKHDSGAGMLSFGGSYVSLVSPDQQDFTLIIETIRFRSVWFQKCYVFAERNVGEFTFVTVPFFNIRLSNLHHNRAKQEYFKQLENIPVVDGMVQLQLKDSEVWTLSTISTSFKGYHPNVPEPQPFPTTYFEDFEGYNIGEEAYYFSQQIGSFEVASENNNKFMRQIVIDMPVHWFWCHIDNYNTSLNVFGDYNWSNFTASVSVSVTGENSTDWVFLASRVSAGGCRSLLGTGLFFYFNPKQQQYMLTTDLMRNNIIASGGVKNIKSDWNDLELTTNGNTVLGYINSNIVFNVKVPIEILNGWAAVGTFPYGYAGFDNFLVKKL
ncbi:hypothetical protein LOTGIDRAFT_206940 [Lottia gigantea]|uniref:galactosylceramidase n=1 Tax=Lottia gigantea TaxID=225164 RepID=V3ZZT9_LOTGI|nr:hypothetical protein LOTGIDRAFT_206940 [Lottia gigantea]ESO88185.1 hypothetical protein LOTGIDRAFT_206940 [Lottia gigantea]